ncbi:bifunctional alpha,alpha-trehalose-phosphate synthase (UDP-forming)/trehalose-phosphatase [Christiangramia crocea]|uniref:Bifunctional alpha,alpha-trehalose-phosphate synthase (UDP-forming)/trehalose-phosphatase n=1 Tax=Christiangramia crocea TaxID=2904124 RepID=A0A9X2A4B0_9FLAO|nr:bifunctional alpha,alpha-trehalose-phosphate synthase (UDP-forming)/trehalose-phosphatase [Gramella crocea]MCG9970350.1 bifunctional alpha,alpha-trehalose-phosphate synthase (UDP-forming)/trehalose-phosphatase [Gramella crocea]
MNKLIIVSNRLPVKAIPRGNSFHLVPTEGGLSTGLKSSSGSDSEECWIGWPGISNREQPVKDELNKQLEQLHLHPVFLSEKDKKNYYEGFSNCTIWPLFHYFPCYTHFDDVEWESYQKVNDQFCMEVLKIAEDNDTVWVHDYHLMLLPALLKKKKPSLKVGFFLHIPFPSYEIFRMLPWASQILDGISSADLIGFHTEAYRKYFHECQEKIRKSGDNISTPRNTGVFPMSINFDKFNKTSKSPEIKAIERKYRMRFKDQKIILSVDRLDYTKGILHRLYAFERFLEQNPKYVGNVKLVMLVVPSRTNVGNYRELKNHLEGELGRINGRFSHFGNIPIHYFYRSLPFNELVGLYKAADIALVTPLRDGMNLVAKEYVATKGKGKGVLILSKFAGAAYELNAAIKVNPFDENAMAQAIKEAVEQDEAEQEKRMRAMRRTIKINNVDHWKFSFLNRLNGINSRKAPPKQTGRVIIRHTYRKRAVT